ncbi:MAG: lyase family protein [Candidatus Woesearchaeota archaeon]|jgi:adenylosuccinate lyase|nr:lyase family protein [Candidatus Woesearchaeota archaeon]
MEITEIFTKKNIEILELLKKGGLHLRDIAAQLKCSPAKVHDTIKLFVKNDLIRITEVKNRKIITLNKKSQLLKEIQNITSTEKQPEKQETENTISIYDSISPIDFRYYGRNPELIKKLSPYLSEEGFTKYLAKVEAALTRTLAKKGVCSKEIADEVENATKQVTADEVYKEEDRIKHNIRALANSIRKKVSDKAKPYVHFTTTSHDIICTADSLRYKDFTNNVLLQSLLNLENTLINLALREKATLQIGRTHGQHAEPITFGFTIANYISRLGSRIQKIKSGANNLRGKIAGAVGAYNASSLFFKNPVEFERQVLAELDLKPSPISTQVIEAEFMTDYIHAITSCFGVLANIADDMRQLQRSEIAEVGEHFEEKQVGSSTMPQKRNPINFENIKSMWKEFMPRIQTLYMDQISEHQRDLTNSASSRFIPELLAALYISIERLNKVMSKLVVDKTNLDKNFDQNKEMIAAEPIYILLAAQNHPDAHEAVRELTIKSQKEKVPLSKLLRESKELKPYLAKLSIKQKEMLANPEKYTGISIQKTEAVCKFWKKELKI